MTIDEKISKLESEINVAENNLKDKFTDLNFLPLVKKTAKELISSPFDSRSDTSLLASYMPSTWYEKYKHMFNIASKVVKVLR